MLSDIEVELRRVVRRLPELPAARAAETAPLVRAFAQELADLVRDRAGRDRLAIPDLGAGALPDQLRVMVYDAAAAACVDDLADRLRALRRAIG